MNISDFKYLYEALKYSERIFNQAKGFLLSSKSSLDEYICVYLVGSHGRFEANEKTSDLEWLLVYDDIRVNRQEADLYQAKVTEGLANIVGRERLSIGKTFGEFCSISDLSSNVGGIADTNRMLTYRMLVLAEGMPLVKNATYENIISTLADNYGSTHTSGHRLLSLATDIARHWRTLRIDYKQKVDEQKKTWADRSVKLRSGRRFWYFSLVMHYVAYGPRIDYKMDAVMPRDLVKDFMKTMHDVPSKRLIKANQKLKGDTEKLKEVLRIYNSINGTFGNIDNRIRLSELKHEDRRDDKLYQKLRQECSDLHHAMAELVISLPDWPKRQMIEMFLL